MICIGKTKCTSEKGLLNLCDMKILASVEIYLVIIELFEETLVEFLCLEVIKKGGAMNKTRETMHVYCASKH